jgi:iron complex outermembrane receptor protein
MKTRQIKKVAKKLSLSLISMLSIASFSQTFAQSKITGTIKNEKNSEVILGAKIFLESTNFKTSSDLNGQFEMKEIPDGTYIFRCEILDYANFMKTVKVKGKDLNINIEMISNSPKDNILLQKNEQEVFVSSTRATNQMPVTFTEINKEQIEKQNFGQDLPYLLESTPSTVVTSDAGAGVGYTGVRIRGVDPTRTNVTVNGIPLNDSESHGVYWVNMPDFASSVDNLQVQRGVGTSTNGAGAFGASINVQTDKINEKAYGEIDNSAGSFNTFRNTVKAGTGLLDSKFAFDMRLSRISSDGFIDRSSSNLKSYFVSGAYVGKKSTLKANVFSGKEITYQAWYGIPEAKLKGNPDSLTAHFYNNYYPGGIYQNAADSANLFNPKNNRTYNQYRYDNETDNYQQSHYQLLYNYEFSKNLSVNLAGHYTHGAGYYEQYRYDDDFSKYGLTLIDTGNGSISSTDLIRRRWLNNDFYGGIFSFNYKNSKGLNLILGGGANQYKGRHYGEIVWARYASQSEIRDTYYDNSATKNDNNIYLKVNKVVNKFNFFADLQVRSISYSYLGVDEYNGNFIDIQQKVNFTFFNPKAGLTYNFNPYNKVYASFAIANREPVRDDFRENFANKRPKHETLQNVEIAYNYMKEKTFFSANYYLMNYVNQLILTGEINDVGGYTRTNADNSYRTGIEFEAGRFFLNKKIILKGNMTLSQNKIKEFTEYIDDFDKGGQVSILHKNSDLAFSPNFIAAINLTYSPIKDLSFSILSKYVSKQFLDNTSADSRSLDAYYITNFTASYSTSKLFGKQITFGLLVNNLFNHEFENNGYTWGYIFGGKRVVENFYVPQAGVNFLGRITVKF